MRERRPLEIFNISFLDVISCAFGAVVLLILLAKDADFEDYFDIAKAQELLRLIAETDATIAHLEDQAARLDRAIAANRKRLAKLETDSGAAKLAADTVSDRLKVLDSDEEGLRKVLETVQMAATQAPDVPEERDKEVGGIPVDSDYVVFIIDTSGSMKKIWGRLIQEMDNILDIHPDVKGFQVMNDMGDYLRPGTRGRWMRDSRGERARVLARLRGWSARSNSSPVEGLEVALNTYARPDRDLSIYILGDEYTGGSYDPVIEALRRLNRDRISDEPLARVHAIGFDSGRTTDRFATLMREVAHQNNGTFLGLTR